jgi:hypothetical protein
MRALFANMDTWFAQAMEIAESDNPRPLALNHARNLLQCRGALSRLLAPEDVPPAPDEMAAPCCPPECRHNCDGTCPPRYVSGDTPIVNA